VSVDPVAERPVLVAPCKVAIELTCPTCGAIYSIPATIGTRVTRDDVGKGTIRVRLASDSVAHLCAQQTLGLRIEQDTPHEPGGPDDGGTVH
jgi:hypothetical protein